jgi:hypothetical protein
MRQFMLIGDHSTVLEDGIPLVLFTTGKQEIALEQAAAQYPGLRKLGPWRLLEKFQYPPRVRACTRDSVMLAVDGTPDSVIYACRVEVKK